MAVLMLQALAIEGGAAGSGAEQKSLVRLSAASQI